MKSKIALVGAYGIVLVILSFLSLEGLRIAAILAQEKDDLSVFMGVMALLTVVLIWAISGIGLVESFIHHFHKHVKESQKEPETSNNASMLEVQAALVKEGVNMAFARLESGQLKAYRVPTIDTTKGGGV